MKKMSIMEFCTLNMGQSPDSKTYNECGIGLPFYQGNTDFGEIHPKTRVWCSLPNKIANAGDILISVRAPIGALNIAVEKCCIGRGLAALTPKLEICDSWYLYYALLSQVTFLIKQGTGSTFKAIGKKVLEETMIPVYSLIEQRRIVIKLSYVDKLIVKRNQQLHILEKLVLSRFVEMFGDPVDNPLSWSVLPLTQVGACKNGMNFSSKESGVTIRCLRVADFQDNATIRDMSKLPLISLNEMPPNEYLLQDGDIVFVRSNGNKALVGRCLTVYPGSVPVTYSGFCIRFRTRNDLLLIDYLLRYFKMESVRSKMAGRGANIQNLNQQILSSLQVPVPPIDMQEKYVSFVRQIDKSKYRKQNKYWNHANINFQPNKITQNLTFSTY